MSDAQQMALMGPATPPELRLTRRQRFALEFIARRACSSEDIGAALHEYRGSHPVQRTCPFCKPEGAGMGSRLREFGLVRFSRKLGVWYLLETGPPKPDRGAQTDEIPF